MNEHAQAFGRLLEWKRGRAKERDDYMSAMNARLAEECLAAWKARFPKKKFSMVRSKADNGAEHSAIFERLAAEVKVYSDDWWAEDKQAEWVLDMLAEKADVPGAPEPMCVHSVAESSYSSMGWGAAKYASEAAESRARDFRLHVPGTAVVEEFHPFDRPVEKAGGGTSGGWREWKVMAPVTELGAAILRRKPGETLREFVKSCWKKGVNPRVYMPFLPVGFEEKLGLDRFGNEVSPAA